VTFIRWPWRRACRLSRDPPNLVTSASKGSARARRPRRRRFRLHILDMHLRRSQLPVVPAGISPDLGGPGDGVSVVTGVLAALLTIWLLNAPGGRLRVVADVLRPPDVFFRLERPG
jgi:hypothetical protein